MNYVLYALGFQFYISAFIVFVVVYTLSSNVYILQ